MWWLFLVDALQKIGVNNIVNGSQVEKSMFLLLLGITCYIMVCSTLCCVELHCIDSYTNTQQKIRGLRALMVRFIGFMSLILGVMYFVLYSEIENESYSTFWIDGFFCLLLYLYTFIMLMIMDLRASGFIEDSFKYKGTLFFWAVLFSAAPAFFIYFPRAFVWVVDVVYWVGRVSGGIVLEDSSEESQE